MLYVKLLDVAAMGKEVLFFLWVDSPASRPLAPIPREAAQTLCSTHPHPPSWQGAFAYSEDGKRKEKIFAHSGKKRFGEKSEGLS